MVLSLMFNFLMGISFQKLTSNCAVLNVKLLINNPIMFIAIVNLSITVHYPHIEYT